jgi:hypothetical protein
MADPSWLYLNRKHLPALALLAAVLAFEVLYLAIANPLLASALGRGWLERHPRLQISYENAWTPLPGVVRVQGLRLDYSSAISSWSATARDATGVIVLPELVLKRFHLAGLWGRGVEYRFARLPPPPGGPPQRRTPAWPWRIQVSSAHLDEVESLAVNDKGFRGSAVVSGGFSVSLDGHARVHNSSADVQSGRLWVGERELAQEVRGRLRASVDRFNYRQFRGRQMLPFASGSVDATGQARAADLLGFFLRDLAWLTWSSESSELSANLRMERGQLQPGSAALFQPQLLEARYLDYTVAGEAGVQWSLASAGGTPESLVEAAFTQYQVRRAGGQAPHIQGQNLTLRGSGPNAGLLEAFSGLRLRADMPEAEVPDLRVYGSYLPAGSGLEITGGSARTSGWVEINAADAQGNGELRLRASRAAASYGGLPLSGHLSLRTELRGLNFAEQNFDISGTQLDLTNVCAGECGADDQDGWWARVKLDSASLAPGREDTVRATVAATMRDSRPLVLLFASRRGLPKWAQDVLTVEDVASSARITMGKDGFTVRELLGTGEQLELRARLDFRPQGRSGQIYMQYKRLGLGMDLAEGERNLRFVRPLQWYERGGGAGSARPSQPIPAADRPRRPR